MTLRENLEEAFTGWCIGVVVSASIIGLIVIIGTSYFGWKF